jgi:predicted nucleic acid-binding Zn ribbon protein
MITAKPLRMCPNCGKKRLKRLIGTGAGIIFKGSGFYQTDYRSESYKKAEKSEKSSAEKKPATEGKEPKPVKKDKSNLH